MKKIKVGFLPLYIKLYDDASGPSYRIPMEKYMNMAINMLETQVIELVMADQVCRIAPEFEAAAAASPAWRISGGSGLGTGTFPPCGKLIGNEIGYYLRQGEHAFTPENWSVLLDFADARLK